MHVRLFTNNYDFLVALRLTVQSKLDSLVENSHCLALMMLSKELLTQLVIKGKKKRSITLLHQIHFKRAATLEVSSTSAFSRESILKLPLTIMLFFVSLPLQVKN